MVRNRVFAISLTISTLFHLSMVTLFSIVLLFERREMPYVHFELVQVAADPAPTTAIADDRLELRAPQSLAGLENRLPALGGFNEHDLSLRENLSVSRVVPMIELPTVGFAELDRLRLRQETLAISPDIGRFLDRKPTDPWARFGQELGQLTDALLRLRQTLDVPKEAERAPIHLVSRPAPGFSAYVEWLAPPHDRLVLSTPPVRALWGLDPSAVPEPMTLIFTVNAEGRVVEVLNPVEDELTTSVGIALLKYRFAPLFETGGRHQQGTFRIVADDTL
jgi:hypothetical protein